MSKIAIFSGSFDPLTLGHIDIIKKIANNFQQLIIVVGNNSEKKYLLSLEQRTNLIKQEIKLLSLKNINIINTTGLLIDVVNLYSNSVIVRSIRNYNDWQYEIDIANLNNILMKEKYSKECLTLFINAEANLQYISSSWVKNLIKANASIRTLVSDNVLQSLIDLNIITK